jgi:CubicO group peptidase (beta-lactamase class C family)
MNHSIFCFLSLIVATSAVAMPAAVADPIPDPPPAAPVKTVLKRLVETHILPGVVTLVADKDRVLGVETVGDADIATKKPMRPDTVFWIASMTKPITGVALMLLVDEGKVNLDDPVAKYLPEFKDQWLAVEQDDTHVLLKRPQHSVTVRNLLTHTSGLPHFTTLEDRAFVTPERPDGIMPVLPLWLAVRGYAQSSLRFEPGTRWEYCNAGLNTAGRIVEVVSGMPFEEFLQKRLFHPLGMKDTTFSPGKRQLSRLARSYRPNADHTGFIETAIPFAEFPLTERRREPFPAGGLFSTAADLARFCQMMLNRGVFHGKRIVSEAAVREMTKSQLLNVPYGLGWGAESDGSFGHNGAFGTDMAVYPSRNRIVILLVQHATLQREKIDAGTVRREVTAAVFQQFGSDDATVTGSR